MIDEYDLIDDEELIELTPQAHKALRAGMNGFDPRFELCVLVFEKIGKPMTRKNGSDLCIELITLYGSPEAAVEAVRSGVVKFKKID